MQIAKRISPVIQVRVDPKFGLSASGPLCASLTVPFLRYVPPSWTHSKQLPPALRRAQSSRYDHSVSGKQNRRVPLPPILPPFFRLPLASLRLCVRFSSPFRQHEVTDNRSELTATGDELSKGTAGGAIGIECVYGKAAFAVSTPEIDKLL